MGRGRLVPKRTLQWSEVGGEVVILDREMGELLRLNPTAGFIWKQLDGQRSAETVAEAVSQRFRVSRRIAERDVRRLLTQLVDLELVEKREEK